MADELVVDGKSVVRDSPKKEPEKKKSWWNNLPGLKGLFSEILSMESKKKD